MARFERVRWPDGKRSCPHCGSLRTSEVTKPQPYRCRERKCRKHFSIKTGTAMHGSKLPLRKWLYAVYLMSVSKEGLSSLLLGRELGIAPEAAWRLGQKIREAWNLGALFPLRDSVGVDETFIGVEEGNECAEKRANIGDGTGGRRTARRIRSAATSP